MRSMFHRIEPSHASRAPRSPDLPSPRGDLRSGVKRSPPVAPCAHVPPNPVQPRRRSAHPTPRRSPPRGGAEARGPEGIPRAGLCGDDGTNCGSRRARTCERRANDVRTTPPRPPDCRRAFARSSCRSRPSQDPPDHPKLWIACVLINARLYVDYSVL